VGSINEALKDKTHPCSSRTPHVTPAHSRLQRESLWCPGALNGSGGDGDVWTRLTQAEEADS